MGVMETALKYPIELTTGGKPVIVSDIQMIEQSIGTILTMTMPTFFTSGLVNRLDELSFEPNDLILTDMLDFFIRDAVEKFETRVKITNIDFQQEDSGIIMCGISYNIVGSGDSQTMLFPFLTKI